MAHVSTNGNPNNKTPNNKTQSNETPANGTPANGTPAGRTPANEKLLPVDFAREVLGVTLWSKQEEVLNALPHNRRVAVKSANGMGKGFCAAVAVLWFLYYHDQAIVLTTAPTFRQVRHILWRQIRQLHSQARLPDLLGGDMFIARWELSGDRYAIGLSAGSADQFQGFHSENMLIVVDEAEGVSEEIYEAIESVMTSASPRLLLIGNPTTMTGAFRRAFERERRLYYTVTISALESPNISEDTAAYLRTGPEAADDSTRPPIEDRIVIPGLTTGEWVEERREIWGEDSSIYRSRVLAQFPEQGDDTLIPLSDIEAAAVETENTIDLPDPATGKLPGEVVLAVDVARFGFDRSVILRRRGDRVEDIQTLSGMDTMQVAGRVIEAIRESSPDSVVIDEVGIGAGVVDRLREQGYTVRGINVGRRAHRDDRFVNRRAEGYWRLRRLFESRSILIPPDNRLMGELSGLRFDYDSQGRLKMESKESMRARNLSSPDSADALMLAFLDPPNRVKLWT